MLTSFSANLQSTRVCALSIVAFDDVDHRLCKKPFCAGNYLPVLLISDIFSGSTAATVWQTCDMLYAICFIVSLFRGNGWLSQVTSHRLVVIYECRKYNIRASRTRHHQGIYRKDTMVAQMYHFAETPNQRPTKRHYFGMIYIKASDMDEVWV